MSGNSERGRAAHASPGLLPTPMTGISPGGNRKGRRDTKRTQWWRSSSTWEQQYDAGIYSDLIPSKGGGMTAVGTGIGSAIGDDNIVLPLPSHSVVNYLVINAIRNGVLAVATTTRYKAKVGSSIVATMIMIKR